MQTDKRTIWEQSKVLIVSASEEDRTFFTKSLSGLGCQLHLATLGKSAFHQVEEWHPDVLIIDEELPDVKGTSLLRAVKRHESGKQALCMMISGNGSRAAALTTLQCGAIDLIYRPVRAQELCLKIKNLLDLKHYQNQISTLREREEKLQHEKKLLSRYFSDDLIEQILDNRISTHLGGRHTRATVLFFDLRGSTKIADSLNPGLFSNFLSDVLTDVMDIIYGNGGSVNKLLGDGLLATFGAPVSSPKDAYNAVHCALLIREYLNTYNDVRPDYLKTPLEAGIGIATGKLFAGNIGSIRRMEYTVLGPPVNIASHLQNLTKCTREPILLDLETTLTLKNNGRFKQVSIPVEKIKIPGLQAFGLIDLYEEYLQSKKNPEPVETK